MNNILAISTLSLFIYTCIDKKISANTIENLKYKIEQFEQKQNEYEEQLKKKKYPYLLDKTLMEEDDFEKKITKDVNDLNEKVQLIELPLRGSERDVMKAYDSFLNKKYPISFGTGTTGITQLLAYGPTCLNGGIRYGDEHKMCWMCGERHI